MKKINNIRGMIAVMSFCCVLFMGVTSVRAETTGSVPVTYTREESAMYPLNVEVTGEGEVSTGTDTLRNKKKQYSIPVDESITFQLKADNGRKVKKAVLNGNNVLGSISENKLTVNGAEKEQTLIVEFESKKSVFPQTGDTTQLGVYIVLFFISIVAGGYMYYRDKKNQRIKK